MSFKRSSKPPARPPPPKGGTGGGGLSLAGMSFKKLEDEEEEEDLTISDKYTSLLQQNRTGSFSGVPSSTKSGSLSSTSASALTEANTDPVSCDADDGVERFSPLKKGSKTVFEYKELLTGLKGKIQEKISRTIEDISGESSASVSPDKEHPLSPPLDETSEGSALAEQMANLEESSSTRSTMARRRGSSPSRAVRPNSIPRTPAVRSVSEERPSVSPEINKTGLSTSVSLTADKKIGFNSSAVEKRTAVSSCDFVHKEKAVVSNSAPLTENDKDHGKDDGILVFEEHFKEEPFEDFAGGLTTSTGMRPRSKLKGLKKSPPKTVATVSMSGLMKTPTSTQHKMQATHSKKTAETDARAVSTSHKPASLMQLMSHDRQSVPPWSRMVVFVSGLFVYLIVPMPAFLSGLIAGCVLTSLVWLAYMWVTQPAPVKELPKLTPIEELAPMQIPEMKEPTLEDGTYKGWMNEITNYNPNDYHINHTYSIFVTLEGTKLRLQRPKTPVPKRAMHDENINTAHFIHQRHFELKGSRVFLQPPGLVKKRIWSKKYPICIALSEMGTKIKNIGESSVDGPSIEGPKNDMGFELISEEKCDSSVLFLFARTGREKEEWFRRFVSAAQGKPLPNAILEMRRAIERQRQVLNRRANSTENSSSTTRQRHNSTDSQSSTASDPSDCATVEMEVVDPVLTFTRFMGHLMPAGAFTHLLSPSKTVDKDKESAASATRLPFTGSIICDNQLYWLNALIGRCFYDFLRDGWWADKVKDKLQRKLSKIHVPYFIEELQVTAIDMGKEMPVVRRAANPYLDERGFWVELDVSYGGGFQMTIETKMNLMKLKRSNGSHPTAANTAATTSEKSPVTDSDEEDSAESSTDEEDDNTAAGPEEKESGGSKKLLKYLDKLTSSKYFQQATEYKYIKRAMENVSNTPLQLQVSVKNLVGKLAVNLPPPPSDRLWYGFRGSPRLWLVAKPQVGEHVVTITHITDWIERKLELEFQRVFVVPNMDDLVIPILRPFQDTGHSDDFAS